MEKFLMTALIVGVVGPLFWLGVGLLGNFLESLFKKARSRWRAKKATAHQRLRE
jgi:hypothetical protein